MVVAEEKEEKEDKAVVRMEIQKMRGSEARKETEKSWMRKR